MPSNTEINPKENTKDCKVIELKSGLKLKGKESEKKMENEKIIEKEENAPHTENIEINLGDKEASKLLNPVERPPPPFPNRLKAHNLDRSPHISLLSP